MDCWLTAPRHCLEILTSSITIISVKITYLKFDWILPGAKSWTFMEFGKRNGTVKACDHISQWMHQGLYVYNQLVRGMVHEGYVGSRHGWERHFYLKLPFVGIHPNFSSIKIPVHFSCRALYRVSTVFINACTHSSRDICAQSVIDIWQLSAEVNLGPSGIVLGLRKPETHAAKNNQIWNKQFFQKDRHISSTAVHGVSYLGINFNCIIIKLEKFSSKKMHQEISPAGCRLFSPLSIIYITSNVGPCTLSLCISLITITINLRIEFALYQLRVTKWNIIPLPLSRMQLKKNYSYAFRITNARLFSHPD